MDWETRDFWWSFQGLAFTLNPEKKTGDQIQGVLTLFVLGRPGGLPEMKQRLHTFTSQRKKLIQIINYWTNCCITEVATSWGERGKVWYQAICPLRGRSWHRGSCVLTLFGLVFNLWGERRWMPNRRHSMNMNISQVIVFAAYLHACLCACTYTVHKLLEILWMVAKSCTSW